MYFCSGRPRTKPLNPTDSKLRALYDAIRDYREPKANRQLALVFMKLPSKSVSLYELIFKYLSKASLDLYSKGTNKLRY